MNSKVPDEVLDKAYDKIDSVREETVHLYSGNVCRLVEIFPDVETLCDVLAHCLGSIELTLECENKEASLLHLKKSFENALNALGR